MVLILKQSNFVKGNGFGMKTNNGGILEYHPAIWCDIA